jgi:ABC-type lipopolysaccharide export system ATPase subunit
MVVECGMRLFLLPPAFYYRNNAVAIQGKPSDLLKNEDVKKAYLGV